MKPSLFIALLVGAVIGFAIGKATSTPGAPGSSLRTAEVERPNPQQQRPTPPPADPTVYKVPLDDSPIQGSQDALVTLVEFSDYQCPFCKRADGTVQELRQQYGSKLRVVMKEFPLGMHPNAKPAALAALAAGQQGKYWEMHDKLFGNQQALDPAGLERTAHELGLDVAKWKADQTSPTLAKQIDRDQALGGKLGVTGTPAFFVNGRKLVGAQPIDRFKALIDEELQKAEALTRSGVAPSDVYNRAMERGIASAPQAPAAPPPGPRKVGIPADAPFFGPKAAKVTIVEFSDFQCPFCSRVEPTVKQIKETYGNDVKFVWMNEPLPFHPNARPAAQAAMAAAEQGKFWGMHDKLFANQQALDRAHYEQYAKELGLNVERFKSDMDSKKVADKIEADAHEAQSVGANGTPNFFINGVQVVGAMPFDRFKSVIDEQMARANKLLASGVRKDQLYERLTSEGTRTAQATP